MRPLALLCLPSEDATAQKTHGSAYHAWDISVRSAHFAGSSAAVRQKLLQKSKTLPWATGTLFFLEGFGIARKVFPLCKITAVIFRAFLVLLVPSLTDFADVKHSKPCACYFSPSAELEAAPLPGKLRALVGEISKHLPSLHQQLLQLWLPNTMQVTRSHFLQPISRIGCLC